MVANDRRYVVAVLLQLSEYKGPIKPVAPVSAIFMDPKSLSSCQQGELVIQVQPAATRRSS